MTEDEYSRKLDELDHLLNDPEVPMQPARIWSLLAEISHRDLAGMPAPQPRPSRAGDDPGLVAGSSA